MNLDCILLAEANPNEGYKSAQAPKQDTQGSVFTPNESYNEDPNLQHARIRDVTAYDPKGYDTKWVMRTRSHHSSTTGDAKDDSTKSSFQS